MNIRYIGEGNELVTCTRSELKTLNASDFRHGDVVKVGKYFIHIRYKKEGREYDIPSLLSYVETKDGRMLDSMPGSSYGLTPYYIDDFKSR